MPRSPSYIEVRLKNIRFFDRNVIYGTDVAHHKAMSRFGAYVMKDARRSMRWARKRKTKKNTKLVVYGKPGERRVKRVTRTASPPGTPPRAIVGHIKRFLFFEYEPRIKNVVIGPERLPPASNLLSKHPVPAMHEQRKPFHAYAMRTINKKIVSSVYPQRPYMVPAFDKNTKKLRGLYKNSVRRR